MRTASSTPDVRGALGVRGDPEHAADLLGDLDQPGRQPSLGRTRDGQKPQCRSRRTRPIADARSPRTSGSQPTHVRALDRHLGEEHQSRGQHRHADDQHRLDADPGHQLGGDGRPPIAVPATAR